MGRAAEIVGQHNLPEQLTSLIGRDSDKLQVSRLVAAHRVVRLLVERGRAALGNFSLSEAGARAVVQVCGDLDGLPLALELAA